MIDYDLLPDDKEEDDSFERSDELFEARREEIPVHLEEFFTESSQEKRMAIQDSQAELINDDDFENRGFDRLESQEDYLEEETP